MLNDSIGIVYKSAKEWMENGDASSRRIIFIMLKFTQQGTQLKNKYPQQEQRRLLLHMLLPHTQALIEYRESYLKIWFFLNKVSSKYLMRYIQEWWYYYEINNLTYK